jgi:hypothetical protein
VIDESNNTVHFHTHEELAAPRFDEQARANAQPVVPIPTSRISVWFQRARSLRPIINARKKALAIAIIAGLSVGALGGTLLVKQQAPNSLEDSMAVSPTGEISATPNLETVTEANYAPTDAMSGVEVKVKPRRRYRRGRAPGPPRAYQVDVIR